MLIFCAAKQNRNSIRALLCALEAAMAEGRLPAELPVRIARSHKAAVEMLKSGDVLFLPVMSTQREAGLDTAEAARGRGAFVVAGGPDPSALPQKWLKFADAVCVGEGEVGVERFVGALLDGREPIEAAQIAGFATGVSQPEVHRTDIRRVPPLALRFGVYGAIELTRSCPNACAFCQTPKLFGPPRHRPLESVLEACRQMFAHNMRDLRFIAPNALGYPYWRQLLEALQPLRRKGARVFFGSFPSEVRPESLTPDNLKILKQCCDNRRLVVGVQSGSDATLKRLRRGHTAAQAEAAIRHALEAGFAVEADFIFGFPEEVEPEEELERSLLFAERLVELGAKIHAHWFLPLPGTDMSGMRPCRPSKRLERRLERLLGRAGSGNWRRQRQLADKLPLFPTHPSHSAG